MLVVSRCHSRRRPHNYNTNKMAFANLFTKLCEVKEAVKDSCKSDLNDRSEFTNGKDGPSRKRKTQPVQTGTYLKKHCFQAAASCSVSSEVPYNHKDKALCNNQSERYSNNVKKQKKKNKGKKKQQMAERYRHHTNPNKRRRDRYEDNKSLPKRLMTQEFKDQNALEADGRFICIHHLRGRCIKGDACQLEHIQGYNNLIKEACKFYIQGFCIKGETCPYMHQSFPCKFFHKKGSCRRDDCKFSHDPLNDFTEKLLDDAIKRENELLELNKKDKEPLGQNENVSAAIEENIILQPVRPKFYQSSDPNVDEEVSLSHTEQGADTTEEDTLLQTEDDVIPDNTTPSNLNDPGPVCYSVEAVLGPQFYKPCFYTTPRSEESETTANSTPYSVTNVLRSASQLPPTTQTVLTLDDKTKVSQVHNTFTNPDNFQKMPFKQPPSLNAMSVDRKKEFENENLKLTARSTKNNSELKDTKERAILTNPIPLNKPGASVSECFPPIGSTYPAKNCETSKQQVKAKLCIPDSKRTLKDKITASTRTSDKSSSNTSTTNQATSIHPNLQKRNRGQSLETQQSDCIKNVAKNRQGSVLSSSLATSCDKTTTRAFRCLFTSLVPDSKQSSNVSTSFTNKHAISIAPSLQTFPKSERKPSHSIEHKTESTSPVSSSATTISKVQSAVRCGNLDKTATRKFQSLFPSLHPDVANEQTIPSAQSLQKDQSVCGPSKATKPSKFTENTRKSGNNKEVGVDIAAKCSESSNSQKSSSLTPHSKGENIKDTTGSHKTSANSFSSLFAAPLSKSSPTRISSKSSPTRISSKSSPTRISSKSSPTRISKGFQNISQSIANSVTTSEFCDTNQGKKPSHFIEQMTESTNNKKVGAYLVAACSETSSKPCQKSVSSSPNSNSKGKDTKTHANSFSSLFAAPLSKTCPTNDSPISKKSLESIDDTVQLSDLKVNDKIGYHKSSSESKKTEPCFGTKENSKELRKNTVYCTSSNSSNETSTSQGPLHTTDGLHHNGPPNSVLRSLFQSLSPYKDPHQIQPNVQPVTKLDNIDGESDPAYQPKKKHKGKDKAASPSPPSKQ